MGDARIEQAVFQAKDVLKSFRFVLTGREQPRRRFLQTLNEAADPCLSGRNRR